MAKEWVELDVDMLKSVIDAISCRIVQMLGMWRYHQGISVVPWLAMAWVYKQEFWQVEAIGREKSNPFPFFLFLVREEADSLSSSFFHFFTSRVRGSLVFGSLLAQGPASYMRFMANGFIGSRDWGGA